MLKKVTRDYNEKVKLLLTELSIECVERKAKVMHVLQCIRSCLHNNGVHNNPSMTITIDDCLFSFLKGQRVRCAGWQHIILATEAALVIIEQILKSPKVAAIIEPLPLSYVEPDSKL